MASAQATLKLTPSELQVVSDALAMYAYAMKRFYRDATGDNLLAGHTLKMRGNDSRKLTIMAERIRRDIDLQ